MESSSVALAPLWPLTGLVAIGCVTNSSLAITWRDRKMASSCFHVCVCCSVFPFLVTFLHDPFPMLPTFLPLQFLTSHSSSLLTPLPPFVLPSRWVRAAAVRWPSCPQCLEPAGCCWWGWLCPQTTGWSWWRASSCSRTRAWRWRWRCTQASGEFASWLVGKYKDMF